MGASTAHEFVPTRGELSVVAAILGYAQTHFNTHFEGVSQIDSNTAVSVLQRSGLSFEDLANIWAIADEDGDGNLSERELAIAVRLMGWAQSGKPVDRSFLNYSDGPLPTLKDIWETKWDSGPAPVQLPPVNVHEKIEYHRAFREAGPVNGLLDGEKVRDVYIKSNLSYSELDGIWNVIDIERRGSLNSVEFAVGMYLIQAVKTCQLTALPASIPSHIFDQLSLQHPSPFSVARSPTKSAPLPWKPPSQSVKPVAAAPSRLGSQDNKWDVSVIEQAEASGHFKTLDAEKRGFVNGDESARFMIKFSSLPPGDIAHIWDLVDLRRDNQLNKEQLAVAVHLIHRKLEGAELPSVELPPSLIPPTMRPKPHPRRASAPAVPQKKPPPPPVPPSLSRKASAPTLERRVSLSPPTPRRPPPSRPELRNRFSTPVIPEAASLVIPTSNDTNGTMSPQTLFSALDQETVAELKGETQQLKSQIQELMVQLKAQNQHQGQNDVLGEDNDRLRARIREMEVSLSEAALQASEGANVADDLSREVARLTVLLADHETTETELRETLHSVAELTQQNQSLEQQLEDLAREKESVDNELEETKHTVEQLQTEKDSISTRLTEMEKLLADPQDNKGNKGGSRRELRMLLKDVTRENEQLKRREREMQQSMSEVLLASRNQEQVDMLKRENSRLKASTMELEEVIREMQSSSNDNELRRQINELERQKELLNTQLADMRRRLAEVEGSSERRIGELQRQCSGLAVENERLRRHGRNARSQREDENAPPPAYEEISSTS